MKKKFPESIEINDSSLVLSHQMHQNNVPLKGLRAKASFLQNLIAQNVHYYPAKEMIVSGQSIPELVAQVQYDEALWKIGSKATYFAYEKESGDCVGMVIIRPINDKQVEIMQVCAVEKNCTAEVLRLTEKVLMQNNMSSNLIVKVNPLDNIRISMLRQMGYVSNPSLQGLSGSTQMIFEKKSLPILIQSAQKHPSMNLGKEMDLKPYMRTA